MDDSPPSSPQQDSPKSGGSGDEGAVLKWHKQDPEQQLGFRGGRYTDANKVLSFLIGLLLTAAFFAVIFYGFRGVEGFNIVRAILVERGPTQYLAVLFFFWALGMLWLKNRKLKFQKKAFDLPIMPSEASFALSPETAQDVLKRLHEQVDNPVHFAVLNRVERALSNLDNIGQTADVTAILKVQADNDEAQVAASYGMMQGLVWAIPVLGFIGTVLGLSKAIGAFGITLQQEGDFDGIKDSLTSVTGGLSTAFDTTLLALVLALMLHLVVSFLQSREAEWLDSCNEYCSRRLAGRLRLREK